MFDSINALATVGVRDIATARRFYEDTLGLRQVAAEGEEFIAYRTGDTVLNVYRSQFAGSNHATAVTWRVGDRINDLVGKLRAKGVVFEHYELPGLKQEGDVYRHGDMRVAWFKDPDGNIMSIVSG
jgi:catechol 2,3-dioxygenase-like lactoylglutathione lyase family enzyme